MISYYIAISGGLSAHKIGFAYLLGILYVKRNGYSLYVWVDKVNLIIESEINGKN